MDRYRAEARLTRLPGVRGAGRLMSAQLYGVSFWDPLALALAAGSLAVCALFAALIPAGRAASISPMKALRIVSRATLPRWLQRLRPCRPLFARALRRRLLKPPPQSAMSCTSSRPSTKWAPIYDYLVAHYKQVSAVQDIKVMVPS